MSKSLSKSLHDFFEGQSCKTEARPARSFETIETGEKIPKQLDEVIKTERSTLSNDQLVEGYVVIRLVDEIRSVEGVSGRRDGSVESRPGKLVVRVPECVSQTESDDNQASERVSMFDEETEERGSCSCDCDGEYCNEGMSDVDENLSDAQVRGITSSKIILKSFSRQSLEGYPQEVVNGEEPSISDVINADNKSQECEGIMGNEGENITDGINSKASLSEVPYHVNDDKDDFDSSNTSYANESGEMDNVSVTESVQSKGESMEDAGQEVEETIVDEDTTAYNEQSNTEVAMTNFPADDTHADSASDCSDVDDDVHDDPEHNGETDEESMVSENDDNESTAHTNESNDDSDVDGSEDGMAEDDGHGAKSRTEGDQVESVSDNKADDCKLFDKSSGRLETEIYALEQTKSKENERSSKDTDELLLQTQFGQAKTICKDQWLTPPAPNKLNISNVPYSKLRRKQMKVGTPFPTQPLPAIMSVPSGVLGDGVKPNRSRQDDVDTADTDTPVTGDNISRQNQYSVELECPTAATGQITSTPRHSSTAREPGSRPLSGTFTAYSNLSGRKNPRAKLDSEVRDLERKVRAAQSAQMKSTQRALPPITRATSTKKGMRKPTASGLQKTSVGGTMINEAPRQRKPAVPRLLQSSVCYQDGKVDVSIYSQRGIIDQSDPVQLNINFVREPLKPITSVKSAGNKQDNVEATQRKPIRLAQSGGGSKNIKLSKGLKLKLSQVQQKNCNTRSSLFKNPPKVSTPISKNPPRKLSPLRKDTKKKLIKKKKTLKKKEKRFVSHSREVPNIWSSKFDDIDWNIVERRAQKPPFNTHVDPDASLRHMQFFMDF